MKTKEEILKTKNLVGMHAGYSVQDIYDAMQECASIQTENALKNIIDDIDFGYNAEMIKGKILNGSYR